VDSLQSENLDFNEFQASVEALSMAISTHYPILKGYRDPGETRAEGAEAQEEAAASDG
jgi:hypothetical protein